MKQLSCLQACPHFCSRRAERDVKTIANPDGLQIIQQSKLRVLLALFISALFFLVSSTVFSDQADPRIVITAAANVESNLLARVAEYLSFNYECPVQIHKEKLGFDLKTDRNCAEMFAGLKAPQDTCLIAWMSDQGMKDLSEYIAVDIKVAVINVTAVRYQEEGNVEDRERYARLVERQSMRSVALMLGLKPCPWPQCALNDEIVEQGSSMQWGRNLCPPCQYKAIEIIKAGKKE